MSENKRRNRISMHRDVVKIVDSQEQAVVGKLFPILSPGDVLKFKNTGDSDDFNLGLFVAIREVGHEEVALSVDSGSEAEDAVRAAGVVGARVMSIDSGTVILEVINAADGAGD